MMAALKSNLTTFFVWIQQQRFRDFVYVFFRTEKNERALRSRLLGKAGAQIWSRDLFVLILILSLFSHPRSLYHSIQILREIIIEHSKSAKSAISPHLEALNFDFYEFLHFLKSEMTKLTKSRAPKIAKQAVLELLDSAKIDFT